jgi:hypothetical protein
VYSVDKVVEALQGLCNRVLRLADVVGACNQKNNVRHDAVVDCRHEVASDRTRWPSGIVAPYRLSRVAIVARPTIADAVDASEARWEQLPKKLSVSVG